MYCIGPTTKTFIRSPRDLFLLNYIMNSDCLSPGNYSKRCIVLLYGTARRFQSSFFLGTANRIGRYLYQYKAIIIPTILHITSVAIYYDDVIRCLMATLRKTCQIEWVNLIFNDDQSCPTLIDFSRSNYTFYA